MRTLLITLLLLTSELLFAPTSGVFSVVEPDVIQPYEKLWFAVCEVESNGRDSAVNVTEKAYGIAQIRQIRLDDYAKRTGVIYTLEDCFDKEISKSIFMFYTDPYYTEEYIAKRWNGSGPKTGVYWAKVKAVLHN